jgi:hypothetical protein
MKTYEPLPDTHENLNFKSLHDAINRPAGVYETYDNYWWLTHPEKGIVFYRDSPQCNEDIEIARKMIIIYPWAELKYIQKVYVRIIQ